MPGREATGVAVQMGRIGLKPPGRRKKKEMKRNKKSHGAGAPWLFLYPSSKAGYLACSLSAAGAGAGAGAASSAFFSGSAGAVTWVCGAGCGSDCWQATVIENEAKSRMARTVAKNFFISISSRHCFHNFRCGSADDIHLHDHAKDRLSCRLP